MPILRDADKVEIKKRLEGMVNPVKIINFTQTFECTFCKETRELLEELAALSERLGIEVFNFATDKGQAEKYGIDKIPASVIMGEKDYGIRFYGIPSGYEFATLLDDILMISRGDTGLSEQISREARRSQEAGAPGGVRNAHLTVLSPGRAPCPPICNGKREGKSRYG